MDWMKALLDSLGSSHPELKNSGFAHLANVGELRVDAPYDVADGLQIRKATQNEARSLKSLVDVSHAFTPVAPTRNPYETKIHTRETKQGHVSHSTSDLPEDEWRYHVITFEGTNTRLHRFVDASVLTRCHLVLGPSVSALPTSRGPGIMSGGSAFNRLWNELAHTDEHVLSLGSAELDDLRLVFQKVSAFQDDRVDLRAAMRRTTQLDRIPRRSPLRFLGYISVLESLVTHAPDPKDPHDSLTRQVRQKMLLVGRRSVIPIPYEVFGDDVNEKTLWTRLYEYRSAIAHGATPDFGQRLKCLKDPATALAFVSGAAVALMRQALEEPELIADLRAV